MQKMKMLFVGLKSPSPALTASVDWIISEFKLFI